MKILHTSDWHIGQELSGWSRQIEHDAFFEQLEQIVLERDVDALLVAGDVFDHQNPSAAAQRVFYDALVKLRRAKPNLSTIVIAGNHDAAGRIEAPRALLTAFGVHVVGSVQRRDGIICPETHLVPLRDRRGEAAAWVAALPFLRPVDLPPLAREVDGSPIIESVRALYEEAGHIAVKRIGGEPLIMTGHLHVAGGLESEGAERRILVGGEHAVPPDVFPSAAFYVALGHLHRPQHIGRPAVRYSGSPFPMSATERDYQHGVTLVDLEAGAVPEHIILRRRIPFIRVPQDGAVEPSLVADVLRDAVAKLGIADDAPVSERPFVQLVVKGNGTRSDIEKSLSALPVRVFSIRNERDVIAASAEEAPNAYLADMHPESVFSEAFLRTHGTKPEPGHLAVFHQALSENQ